MGSFLRHPSPALLEPDPVAQKPDEALYAGQP